MPWRALVRLATTVDAPLPGGPAESAISERVDQALRIVASFSGLAQENMSQLGGWRFLELGRRIERAIATCRFVRQFADDEALEVLLELADSQITYRQRYVMVAARAPVVDLVALDPNNPRSVAYQLDRIEQHLAALRRRGVEGRLNPPQQIAVAAATILRTAEPAAVDDALISATENALTRQPSPMAVAAAYLTHNERSEPDWEALA